MSAQSELEAIIDAHLTGAQEAQTQATQYTDQAQTAASSSIQSIGTIPDVDVPEIEIPLFIQPDQDLGDEFKTEYDLRRGQLRSQTMSDIDDFLTTYFPDLTSSLRDEVNEWLSDAIGGGIGLPPAVEQAMWDRGRGREARATAESMNQAVDTFAGRGWDLPAPYLSDVLARFIMEGRRQTSELNREITIESAKIRIDVVKFAIEQAKDARIQIMRTMIDYINALFKIPETAADVAEAYARAKKQLWEGASAYYSALINAARLTLDAQRYNQDADATIVRETARAIVAVIEGRVKAASDAAVTLGNIASARVGALNGLAHIGNLTTEEG